MLLWLGQCEKDKELLQIEIKILKDTHITKVQEMSSTMAQLQRTVASLREQLCKHGLAEGQHFFSCVQIM